MVLGRIIFYFTIVLVAFFSYVFLDINKQIPTYLPFRTKTGSYINKMMSKMDLVNLKRSGPKNMFFPTSNEIYTFSREEVHFIDEMTKGEDSFEVNVYEPTKERRRGVFIFFHGGGFCCGHPNYYDQLFDIISTQYSIAVVAPDYRKSPEHRLSQIFQDSVETLKFVLERYGKEENIVLAGDSSGGGLAIFLTQYLRDNDYSLLPKEQLLSAPIYPWICLKGFKEVNNETNCPVDYDKDLLERGTVLDFGTMEFFLKKLYRSHEEMNSIPYNLFENLDNLPPHYVFTAGQDVLGNEGRYFAECLKKVQPSHHHHHSHLNFEKEIHGFLYQLTESWSLVAEKIFEKYDEVFKKE